MTDEEATTAVIDQPTIRAHVVKGFDMFINSLTDAKLEYLKNYDLAISAEILEAKAECIFITGVVASKLRSDVMSDLERFCTLLFDTGMYICKDDEEYQGVRNYILAKRPKQEVKQE